MDNPAPVHCRKDVGERRHQIAHLGRRQLEVAREPVREAFARDELHRIHGRRSPTKPRSNTRTRPG